MSLVSYTRRAPFSSRVRQAITYGQYPRHAMRFDKFHEEQFAVMIECNSFKRYFGPFRSSKFGNGQRDFNDRLANKRQVTDWTKKRWREPLQTFSFFYHPRQIAELKQRLIGSRSK
jgi:hypothetical protein